MTIMNAEKREQTDYNLRNRGLVRDEFGHYDDPNDPCRTGGGMLMKTEDFTLICNL